MYSQDISLLHLTCECGKHHGTLIFKCDVVRVCAKFFQDLFPLEIPYSANIYFSEQKASSDNLFGICCKTNVKNWFWITVY